MIGELLDELRGKMNKSAFSAHVGISRRMLSKLYARDRKLGTRTMTRLLRMYPEQRDRIIGVFLSRDEHSCAETNTIAQDEQALS